MAGAHHRSDGVEPLLGQFCSLILHGIRLESRKLTDSKVVLIQKLFWQRSNESNEETALNHRTLGELHDAADADGWDWRLNGRSRGDPLRNPSQGVQLRQHLDCCRRNGGLYRPDYHRPICSSC